MAGSSSAEVELKKGRIMVLMKGLRCTGKTTLARELARSLVSHGYDCSLLSHEDILASINETFQSSPRDRERNHDLAYDILWRMAYRTFCVPRSFRQRPRSIVLDSSLPSQSHLNQINKLTNQLIEIHLDTIANPREILGGCLIVVDCRPSDECMWRQWFQCGAAETDELTWEEVQRASPDFEDGDVYGFPRIIVDTTHPMKSTQDHVVDVLERISFLFKHAPVEPYSVLTREEGRSGREVSWRHFSHRHSLLFYPDHTEQLNDNKTAVICPLCRDTPSGPVYGCSQCQYYLHERCAQFPYKFEIAGADFVLGPTYKEEIVKSDECVLCYGSSGILYGDVRDGSQVHWECAQLPARLKHSCHEHQLLLRSFGYESRYLCGACGTYGTAMCYYCRQCDACFHTACTLHLEPSVMHKCHWHPLELCLIPKDGSNEYYCEICANDRHPDLWAYYCAECEYEAHLSCVNPLLKPCDEKVFSPEYKGEGHLIRLLEHPHNNKYEAGVRNPVLGKISGSKLSWKIE